MDRSWFREIARLSLSSDQWRTMKYEGRQASSEEYEHAHEQDHERHVLWNLYEYDHERGTLGPRTRAEISRIPHALDGRWAKVARPLWIAICLDNPGLGNDFQITIIGSTGGIDDA